MLARAFLVVVIMSIVLPLTLVSLLADFSIERAAFAFGVIALGALIYFTSSTRAAEETVAWMSHGWHPFVMLSVYLFICIAMLAYPKISERRSAKLLQWNAVPTHFKMQRYGLLYLHAHGWSTDTFGTGIAGTNVYYCRKQELRLIAVFFLNQIPLERLLRNLITMGGVDRNRVVLVLLDRPIEAMARAIKDAGMRCLYYKDLENIEVLCQQAENERLLKLQKRR